jgi:hypothetical protein
MNGSLLAFQDIRFPSLFETGEFDKMRVVEGLGSIQSHLFHRHTILQPFDGPSYHFRCYEDENIGLINLSHDQIACANNDVTTSIDDATKEQPFILPNPACNFVTVQNNELHIDNYIVVDILGSIRIREKSSTQTIHRIYLNELEEGLYFIIGLDKTGMILFAEKLTKFGG